MEKRERKIDWNKIALFLKIGILGAFVILAGDLLMGWGVKDTSISGIEGQLSPYLTISDHRMFLASFFGLTGVPMAVVGHYGIYKLLKPYSQKYARLYGIGNVGFLIFGGAGVHVSSVEAAFFYKYMTKSSPDTVLGSTVKFALYFLLPLSVILITCWLLMIYAHIRAVLGGCSPYPRWCAVFSMLAGTLLFSMIGLFGNHKIVNALMVGAFSLGNIWTLSGHLLMLRKARENVKEESRWMHGKE